MTNKEFVLYFRPLIRDALLANGYSENVTEAVVEQACCESAYVRSALSAKYHNYFVMKCVSSYKGKSVNMKTKEEYEVGTLTTIKDNFRAYDSVEDGIAGYFEFLRYTRYAPLKTCTTNDEYCELLKKCGWATSSTYVTTLKLIVKSISQYQGEYDYDADVSLDVKIAYEVIAGRHGSGEKRKQNLGSIYEPVQAIVNNIVRGIKWKQEPLKIT